MNPSPQGWEALGGTWLKGNALCQQSDAGLSSSLRGKLSKPHKTQMTKVTQKSCTDGQRRLSKQNCNFRSYKSHKSREIAGCPATKERPPRQRKAKKGRQVFNIQTEFGIFQLQLKVGKGHVAAFVDRSSSSEQGESAEASPSLAPLLEEGSAFACLSSRRT